MSRAEAEQEELSEWVVIQTSPKSPQVDLATPQSSPILQQRENPLDDDDNDEDSVVSLVGQEEEEEGKSSSTVYLWLPRRVIDAAKKRLKDSGFFHKSVEERERCKYPTRRRAVLSLTIIGCVSLVASLIYVKLVKWWKRLHDKKLTFLLLLLKEKDEKIKELMIEIGRLKELLSSRRRVQVVRIV